MFFLLQGKPGTGKTHVTNAIKALAKRFGAGMVKSTAFMGVAAYLTGGSTIHSLFAIPARNKGDTLKSLTPEQRTRIKQSLEIDTLSLFNH